MRPWTLFFSMVVNAGLWHKAYRDTLTFVVVRKKDAGAENTDEQARCMEL